MLKAPATTSFKKPRKPNLPEVDDSLEDNAELGFARLNDVAEEPLSDSLTTLPEMEREIGIADWLDPETGEPAEGQSPPHLDAE